MTIPPSQFSPEDVQVLEQKTVFQGFFSMLKLRVKHRLFNGGWSEVISREVFQRGSAAAAVLYDPKNDLIGLVDQFRIGALASRHGPWCLEVVAGMIEGSETPEQLVLRELEEEAGIGRAELIHISTYFSTPGGCSEQIHLYCALCDLKSAAGVFGLEAEGEDIRLHVLNAEDVFLHVLDSRANNAATIIGLQWLQMQRPLLRRDHSLE